jgi:hypothetical protein
LQIPTTRARLDILMRAFILIGDAFVPNGGAFIPICTILRGSCRVINLQSPRGAKSGCERVDIIITMRTISATGNRLVAAAGTFANCIVGIRFSN